MAIVYGYIAVVNGYITHGYIVHGYMAVALSHIVANGHKPSKPTNSASQPYCAWQQL